ncbi:MAG: hypothetical protein V4642_00865 [Bacteroidota bacterium]
MKSTILKLSTAAALSVMLFSSSFAQTGTTTTKKEKTGSISTSTGTTTAKKSKTSTAATKLLKKIDARLKLTKAQESQVLQMIQTSNNDWTTTTTTFKKGSAEMKSAMNTSAEKLEGNIKAILTADQLKRYTKSQSAIRKDLDWKALAKK